MFLNSAVTVAATPTVLVAASVEAYEREVLVQNNGSVDVYVGGNSPTLSTSNGIKVGPGQTLTTTLGRLESLYGIVASSTSPVIVAIQAAV